jgi:hypothetical protein
MLLVEDTGVPGDNQSVANGWNNLITSYRVHLALYSLVGSETYQQIYPLFLITYAIILV